MPLIDKGLYKSVKGNPPGIPSCGKIPQCSLALMVLSGDVCVQNVWVGDELDLNLREEQTSALLIESSFLGRGMTWASSN